MIDFGHLSYESNKSDLLCDQRLADAFIAWFIWKTVDSFGEMGYRDVPLAVSENYSVNNKACMEYVRAAFEPASKTTYRLSKDQKMVLSEIEAFTALRQEIRGNAKITLSEALAGKGRDRLTVCAALSCLHQSVSGLKDVDYQTLYFIHLLSEKADAERIAKACQAITEEVREQPINSVFRNEYIASGLPYPSFTTFGSMLSLGELVLSDLFFIETDKYVELLESLSQSPEKSLKTIFNEAFIKRGANDDSARFVFAKRFGVGNGLKTMTLEEVAAEMGLTRERVRQIGVKLEMKLHALSDRALPIGLRLFSEKFPDFSLIDYDDAKSVFKDRSVCDTLAIMASSKDGCLCYDLELACFYDPLWTDSERIVDEVLSRQGEFIKSQDFDAMKPYEKRAILKEYSLRNVGYYLKKNVSTSRMIIAVMEKYFQTGYNGYDEEHYADLCSILRREYGREYPVPSMQAMRGLIGTEELFCQIDKGLHVPRSLTTEPDIVLLTSIAAFLDSEGGPVYYRTIYEKYRDEFEAIGVKNHYYAKGLIDPYLRDYGFHTKRDYIIPEGSSQTAGDAFRSYLEDQTGQFTFQDIRNAFPGVKDYVFQFRLNDMPNILNLGGKRYISIANCGVTEIGRKMIDLEVDVALNAGDGFVTCHRVWTNLYMFHPGFEKEMGSLRSSFALFSYINARDELREKYDLRRPYILRKGTPKPSEATFLEYFLAKRSFTIKECAKYREKLGIKGGTWSFIGFVESVSDDFVLIDRYEARRTDAFPITEKELASVRNTLLRIVRNRGEFSSNDEVGLSMLPETAGGIKMSTSLLLGITWTYLQDTFVAEVDKTIGTGMKYTIKEAQ